MKEKELEQKNERLKEKITALRQLLGMSVSTITVLGEGVFAVTVDNITGKIIDAKLVKE